MDIRTIDDLDVAGKRVLVRADLNVPMKDGRITDSTRVDRFVPTVEELCRRGARVLVASHLGRPKGKRQPDMSLQPLVAPLVDALGGRSVAFAEDCVGDEARRAAEALGEGEVLLLENLRFHPGEEKNDPGFAAALAELADVYVDDAFSAAHRAHASIEGIAHLLPSAAGRMMQAEIEALTHALEDPARPVAGIVGGAKISTKLEVLGHLVGRMDALVIGGAMANTFLFAQGVGVGKSLCERDMADTARRIMADAGKGGCEILLPVDAVVAAELKRGVATQTVPIGAVPDDGMILDVGPESIRQLIAALQGWKTVLWNGPLGAFETAPFDAGTNAFAVAVAERTESGTLLSVAGGGDTVSAVRHAGVIDRLSYVSTAGGAFLEWMEGKSLPGVTVLMKTKSKDGEMRCAS
ncbi:MAG: phosphoglycerate kinase [Acetobacterales bacterium]